MKLIYLVTEDWYFHSHRLPMARGAQQAGFDVAVVTNVHQHKEAIEACGIRVIPWSLDRKSLNPFSALRQIFDLIKIYHVEKPDLVHHIAMKPILFGSIAAVAARVPRVLNAFAGLGVIFNTDIPVARVIRPFLLVAFRGLLKRPGFWLLFQNPDDRARMARFNVVDPARTVIIRGSGVDVARYPVTPLPPAPPFICAFAGRMIDTKGLPTMKTAFEILATRAPEIQLWLCGKPDSGNPGTWDEARLRAWVDASPNVKWIGFQAKMSDIWTQSHLALQPSWGGEGLPKALLEAGACARAMVASDVSGCREVVIPGQNGFLVPAEDGPALAEAIYKISQDFKRCTEMGQQSRAIVEGDLSADSVGRDTGALYRKMMGLTQ